MKYCRFQLNTQAHYGLVESIAGNDQITRILLTPPHQGEGNIEDLPSKRVDHISLSEAELLAPVQPSKIVCIGRNYKAHAAEFGHDVPSEPLIFLKPPSALLAPRGTIVRPIKLSERVDYEGELGIVIGKRCSRLKPDSDVRPYILGYTCINDVTARDLQNKDGQWSRAKGFDTFCPVGPVVVADLDPWAGVAVGTRLNGTQRQQGNTTDLIFAIDVVIRHISQVMTLYPGDLIATGTPEGVGPIVAGDVVEVTVAGVGTLTNTVADEVDA
jgi:2-keto-4-pentenoate hydratase/2-oxohepta-3-ene-1,7-dioic acid hydratase in catechol pathway